MESGKRKRPDGSDRLFHLASHINSFVSRAFHLGPDEGERASCLGVLSCMEQTSAFPLPETKSRPDQTNTASGDM